MQKQEKGLKFGKTDAYTDLSDAFLIKEASKINYELPQFWPQFCPQIDKLSLS